MFFANITSWSEHAVNYLTKLEDHFILAAETHLTKEEGEKVMRSKAMRSWHATAAPASPTGRSEKGTHGGCLALARKGISTVPLASCSGPEGTLYDRSDLSGRVLSVQGGSILVLVAYFQDGEGFGCKNLELLEEIEVITERGKLPFILLADFNIEPEEWSKLAWLERNGAAVIRPEGVEATCRKGRER